MTLENCKKLIEHFEKLSRGDGIPENHRDKNLVMANAKVSLEEMKKRFVAKGGKIGKTAEEKAAEKEAKKVAEEEAKAASQ